MDASRGVEGEPPARHGAPSGDAEPSEGHESAAATEEWQRFGGLLVAHRCHSGDRPENTISAMKALAPWVDGVEVDVRLTRDGVPVLMHDQAVSRTTDGEGPVGEHASEEVATLDAGQSERVPTLEGFLQACRSASWQLILVDMKEVTEASLRAVTEVVEGSSVAGACVLMVRPGGQAAAARDVSGDLRLGSFGATAGNVETILGEMLATGGELVLTRHHEYLANRPVIARVHQAGLRAGCSINNDHQSLIAAAADGCDVIVTDLTDELPRPAEP